MQIKSLFLQHLLSVCVRADELRPRASCREGILHLRTGTRRQSPSEGDGIVRVMLHSLMPHTNALSQRKDHMTMYYISYSDYWIRCTVLFYSVFNKSVAKIYTRYECRKVLSFCPTVLGPFRVLLRRKYEINAWIGFGGFWWNFSMWKVCGWIRGCRCCSSRFDTTCVK